MRDSSRLSMETQAVHAGIGEYEHLPVVPPIYQTSTFAFESADQGAALFHGKRKGYIYTRMGNPTVEALEKCLATLEGGYGAFACGSGMAAIHTALAASVRAGDHVVYSSAMYGPTTTLLRQIMARFGVEMTAVASENSKLVEHACQSNTRVIFIETPGNPTLVISDLEAIAAIAHERNALLIVDNTFMSPVLQRPLEYGADMVVHSLTKFLNGHADVVGGAVIVKDREHATVLREVLNHLGGILSPFEAFLVHRGIKTLPLRMKQHCLNALKIAEFLSGHPGVEWVMYPGLRSHPQYDLARRQMTGAGAVIAFELRGGIEAGKRVMDAVRLFALAVSLGGVESLIQHPASMTHATMGREARKEARITDGLVRISVGIENADELIADLEQALDKVVPGMQPARQEPPAATAIT